MNGYKVCLFLPAQLSSAYNPADRIRIAKLYGCEVTPVDLDDYLENVDQLGAVEKAAAFVAVRMKQCSALEDSNPSTWWSNQLYNPDNTEAHCEGTGEQILEQMGGCGCLGSISWHGRHAAGSRGDLKIRNSGFESSRCSANG